MRIGNAASAVGSAHVPEVSPVVNRMLPVPIRPFVQRKCAACENEEQINRKSATGENTRFAPAKGSVRDTASSAATTQIQATKGGGSALSETARSFMESRMGADFSQVRIHTGDYAVQLSRDLNAQAFTVGSDIYFNSGKFSPDSSDGKRLLAHELTHVGQQSSQSKMIQRQHEPGGPYHPPEGTDLRCTSSDSCSQLSLKINYLRHTILRHQQWDIANPMPQYPNGRHAQEIAELQNALVNCIGYTVRCRDQPVVIPVPDAAPARDRSAANRRIATAAAIGAGFGLVGGAIIGAVGGGVGGTLVAPGVGTVGVGAAGGIAGAAYGAGVGGVVGGAVMGGAQALWEWIAD